MCFLGVFITAQQTIESVTLMVIIVETIEIMGTESKGRNTVLNICHGLKASMERCKRTGCIEH